MKYKGNLPSDIVLPSLYALCPQGKKRNVTPETQNICTEEEEQEKVPVINRQNIKLPHIFVPPRNSLSIPFPFPKPIPQAGKLSPFPKPPLSRRNACNNINLGTFQGLSRDTDDGTKQKNGLQRLPPLKEDAVASGTLPSYRSVVASLRVTIFFNQEFTKPNCITDYGNKTVSLFQF